MSIMDDVIALNDRLQPRANSGSPQEFQRQFIGTVRTFFDSNFDELRRCSKIAIYDLYPKRRETTAALVEWSNETLADFDLFFGNPAGHQGDIDFARRNTQNAAREIDRVLRCTHGDRWEALAAYPQPFFITVGCRASTQQNINAEYRTVSDHHGIWRIAFDDSIRGATPEAAEITTRFFEERFWAGAFPAEYCNYSHTEAESAWAAFELLLSPKRGRWGNAPEMFRNWISQMSFCLGDRWRHHALFSERRIQSLDAKAAEIEGWIRGANVPASPDMLRDLFELIDLAFRRVVEFAREEKIRDENSEREPWMLPDEPDDETEVHGVDVMNAPETGAPNAEATSQLHPPAATEKIRITGRSARNTKADPRSRLVYVPGEDKPVEIQMGMLTVLHDLVANAGNEIDVARPQYISELKNILENECGTVGEEASRRIAKAKIKAKKGRGDSNLGELFDFEAEWDSWPPS